MKPLLEQDYENISRTQLAAMKRQILDPRQTKFTGKILGSSWNRIPAVSKVTVRTQDFNAYLEEIGIKHKLPPKLKFERNPNHKLNRYIGHQIKRLRLARINRNERLFWVIAWACLKSSVSFRLSAINHVKANWWFGLSADRIHQINRRVNVIFAKLTPTINFRRVYIPKPGNKWRPLGVPSDEWRIVLHMVNNMMILWFEDTILDCQHAYIPGRGCMTAWKTIIEVVIKSKFIYETDLKGFFDNVSIFKINNILNQGNVPSNIRQWINKLQKSLPKLPKDKKLSEDKYESIKNQDVVHIRREYIEEFLTREDGPAILSQNLDEETRQNALDIIEKRGLLPEYFLGFANRNAQAPGGVPQGSPLSPFLSILAIRDYLSQEKCVNYADDQIFHSNKLFEIKDSPMEGIIHNKEKSGWIRKDGVWLKELKFLGLIYNPWTGKLRSETRSGRAERLRDSLLELLEDLSYDKDENYLESLVQKNIFGFAMSCLYNGSWNQLQFPTKERIVNKNSFLGRYVNSRVFSSAALDVLGSTLNLRKGSCLKTSISQETILDNPVIDENSIEMDPMDAPALDPRKKDPNGYDHDLEADTEPFLFRIPFETQQEDMLRHLRTGGRVPKERPILEDADSVPFGSDLNLPFAEQQKAMLKHISMAWDDRLPFARKKPVPKKSPFTSEEIDKFRLIWEQINARKK